MIDMSVEDGVNCNKLSKMKKDLFYVFQKK